MKSTELLYLKNMQMLEGDAQVISVFEEDEKMVIILDQSYFYPQGGGQPYDQGLIENESGRFNVEEVRFVEGLVKHIGQFERGMFEPGEIVSYTIDSECRQLHMRLHSGGHVVDMALFEMGVNWKPGKGYHFPDSPYVEYQGSIEGRDKEAFIQELQEKAAEIIARDLSTTIQFMPKEQMHTVCHNVPDYLPEGKPARVVIYGDFGVPCGGTHVGQLSDIKRMTIRKIKNKGGNVKVSYNVERES